VNQFGTFKSLNWKIPSSFQKRWEKQKKLRVIIGNIYGKSVFDKIDFGFDVTLKQITVDTCIHVHEIFTERLLAFSLQNTIFKIFWLELFMDILSFKCF